MAEPVYRRVVIKLSGEYLAGAQSFGIDQPTVDRIAGDLIAARQLGAEIAVVVGGGNIVRGVEVSSRGVSRPTGDTMGMLATVMNCLALEAAIERRGAPARTLSAFVMPQICELFTRSATHKYLAEGRIVLLGGGTGNPFFTTDTTAVLRAAEIGAQAVLKATNVDGVYSADPKKDPSAKRFDRLTHSQAIEGGYKVMDATAFALARETSLPIIVFSIAEPGSIGAILRGTGHGTSSPADGLASVRRMRRAGGLDEQFSGGESVMPTGNFDINELKRRMQGATQSLKHELGGLRTGRAAASMLEPVQVDAYGTHMPLNQLATISVPEPRLLSVQVWDKSMVKAVEKAIVDSNLGLSPATEGQVLRLRIPELNEERRKELVKVAHKYAEAAKRRGPPCPPRWPRYRQEAREESRDFRGRSGASGRRRAEGDRRDDFGDRSVAGGQGKGNPHRLGYLLFEHDLANAASVRETVPAFRGSCSEGLIDVECRCPCN